MDDATVSLFDIDGRGGVLSRLRYPTAGAGGAAGRLLLSAASFHSPLGATMSGLSSLFWGGRQRRNSSGGSSTKSGGGAGGSSYGESGSSGGLVGGDHFTSPQRHQQPQHQLQQRHHSGPSAFSHALPSATRAARRRHR
uniref:WD_REPEATS_REGION domain-containing protein n=1 Tax=Globodera pallida TaxID=36090 RepID=A0A183CM81_GLOPA